MNFFLYLQHELTILRHSLREHFSHCFFEWQFPINLCGKYWKPILVVIVILSRLCSICVHECAHLRVLVLGMSRV